jgi:hypothetical protein
LLTLFANLLDGGFGVASFVDWFGNADGWGGRGGGFGFGLWFAAATDDRSNQQKGEKNAEKSLDSHGF